MIKRNFHVADLGVPKHPNPVDMAPSRFVGKDKKIAHNPYLYQTAADGEWQLPDFTGFEPAGPREHIYFNPQATKVAIVSCGGLCPGINGVIRALVMQLWYRYGVKNIVGARFGYQGLSETQSQSLLELHPDTLDHIHETGGSFLGSSRGSPPTEEILETLITNNIQILFTIGGDGTMRGAHAIHDAAKKRDYPLAVVGVPKTIDNDIAYVRQSFGFETAVSIAYQALQSAHNEAKGYKNGIGLVKLMGRHSGYIAATASLAAGHVNFCLVPEVPFYLEGDTGLLNLLEKRLDEREHALVVVAEGAGQHYFSSMKAEHDASGNIKLGNIGHYLKERFSQHFSGTEKQVTIKYIDPSYLIRSAPANPADQLFCTKLAQNAVHAAMAGKTGLMIGYWHGSMTHVPLSAVNDYRQSINPGGHLWFNILETTGQAIHIGNPKDFNT
ncbi:MAG: ATP-dependent 6-phosphofructokinase [Oligoflexales bacterium]